MCSCFSALFSELSLSLFVNSHSRIHTAHCRTRTSRVWPLVSTHSAAASAWSPAALPPTVLERCSGTSLSVVYHRAHWPRELAPVTLLPPRPPTTLAPVRTVLVLPTGYNYSAFSSSPSSFPLMFALSVSLALAFSARLLTPRSRKWAVGPSALCSQHAERHWLYSGSEQVGEAVMRGGNSAGRLEGRWGRRRWPAAQQPAYLHLPFSLFLSFPVQFLISFSISAWMWRWSLFWVLPLSCNPAWRTNGAEDSP